MRKKAPLFRPTALDDTNVDTAKISPGQYEVLKVSIFLFLASWI